MSANIVSVDEESLRKDINNLVRKTVEETLNALLDEETSELVGAERYRRRLTSVEEAIVELYLVGVSTRRIKDVSELLWGAPVSSGTVSNLNEWAFASIGACRQRPLDGGCPFVIADGICLKRRWGDPART